MTRYVYILTSHENNNYAAMCLISALSVRGIDADARITVLSDALTISMLKCCKHQLLEVADEVLDGSLTEPPKMASRILKTTLLQRLQTDFIFLDVDTIVVRPIKDRLLQPYSIQMALDRSTQYPKPGFPDFLIPHYEKLGWEWPFPYYYNSGVMFVRADDAAKQLFEEWQHRWHLFLSSGLHYDQPALNSSIHALGLTVGCLPIPYNAMIRVDESFRRRARVLHFFAEGSKMDEGTEYTRLTTAVNSGLTLNYGDVRRVVSRRWPLVEPESLRRHLKAGSLHGAWLHYQKRFSANLLK